MPAGALVVFAAIIFGVGINWGLPSHAADVTLFGATAGGPNPLMAYRVSGAGINRLAGDWDQNGKLAADVAAHPLGERSQPIVLLHNHHPLTPEEIAAQGDATMAGLLKATSGAAEQFAYVQSTGGDAASERARDILLAAQKKMQAYADAANRKRFGDLSAETQDDDVMRARILRRFRLYSFQPDEMISFRALAMMHPGRLQFDPKLYQYGGLWIYPLGAIVKAAGVVGYVTISNDASFYLDSPEVFGRFYILGRAYSAAWGIVAALAVFSIARELTGSVAISFLAGLGFICLPVVVDLAHEAKPHLAGAALMLLAVRGAIAYARTGSWKAAIWTSIACGACAAMVLSGMVAVVIIPAMALVRRDRVERIAAVCAAGFTIFIAVYFAANPYVAIHLLGDKTVLQSNLDNTRAMYGVHSEGGGFVNAVMLLLAGSSWPVGLIGAAATLAMIMKKPLGGLGWLIGIPASMVAVQFALFAAGKPGEYARFGLFVDAALMLTAFVAVSKSVRSRPVAIALAAILVVAAGVYSAAYEIGFVRDGSASNSRSKAAATINQRLDSATGGTLYVTAEPAPYCLPPVDLFGFPIVLLPAGVQQPAAGGRGVVVQVENPTEILNPRAMPIGWADVQFSVAEPSMK